MIIRKASAKDLERVNSLLYQVLEIHASKRPDIFISGRKKYTDQQLIDIFNDKMTPVFVAEDENGVVVGYAFCVIKEIKNNNILVDRKELYIDDLCVDESSRGKHIGTRLFEFVQSFAKENGFDAITLNVWSLNESAHEFYLKCGFSPLKTLMEMKL